jgi:hypothetical protein
MDTRSHRSLTERFPKLASTPYRITSPFDPLYNCIAWAASDARRWWEPDEEGKYHWPTDAPRDYSLDAYVRAFESLGFERCDSSELEPGFEKVAVFADATGPTHAAKQLSNGNWSSKLGILEDIEHVLEALVGDDGDEYGQVVQVLKRAPGRSTLATPVGIPIVQEAERERTADGG